MLTRFLGEVWPGLHSERPPQPPAPLPYHLKISVFYLMRQKGKMHSGHMDTHEPRHVWLSSSSQPACSRPSLWFQLHQKSGRFRSQILVQGVTKQQATFYLQVKILQHSEEGNSISTLFLSDYLICSYLPPLWLPSYLLSWLKPFLFLLAANAFRRFCPQLSLLLCLSTGHHPLPNLKGCLLPWVLDLDSQLPL